MLDRESTFARPGIVKMLKTDFIPVAIDQAYHRRQKDTEGDFYRKIAGQGPRNNFQGTTQGFYIAAPDGTLLLYNNNRDPQKVERLMKEKLAKFKTVPVRGDGVEPVKRTMVDPRWNYTVPKGGLTIRVRSKILSGYKPTEDRWKAIFQSALSRDNLWTTKDEHLALVKGKFPKSLAERIARFHLVDNTRGEPPMWNEKEISALEIKLDSKGVLTGSATLKSGDGKRSYEAQFRGHVETKGGAVTRFDMVALGLFEGSGTYTRNAPEGKFPLAISFELADGKDVADLVRPQGSRGWVQGYLR